MSKMKRAKRKMVSMVLWHTIGTMTTCTYQISEWLHIEGGTPVHRDHPLRDTLTDKEFKIIHQRIERMREILEDLRKVAKHLEKSK